LSVLVLAVEAAACAAAATRPRLLLVDAAAACGAAAPGAATPPAAVGEDPCRLHMSREQAGRGRGLRHSGWGGRAHAGVWYSRLHIGCCLLEASDAKLAPLAPINGMAAARAAKKHTASVELLVMARRAVHRDHWRARLNREQMLCDRLSPPASRSAAENMVGGAHRVSWTLSCHVTTIVGCAGGFCASPSRQLCHFSRNCPPKHPRHCTRTACLQTGSISMCAAWSTSWPYSTPHRPCMTAVRRPPAWPAQTHHHTGLCVPLRWC
jgi:hypothetical protein